MWNWGLAPWSWNFYSASPIRTKHWVTDTKNICFLFQLDCKTFFLIVFMPFSLVIKGFTSLPNVVLCFCILRMHLDTLHSPQSGCNEKRQITTNIGQDVGKLEPSYTPDGNVKWCNHFGKQPGCFSKTTHRVTIWLRNSTPKCVLLCGIWPHKLYGNAHGV